MSMVLCVFFRATGRDAQRVVDRGISSNSFLLEEGMKNPQETRSWGFWFRGAGTGSSVVPLLAELAGATLRLPATLSPPPSHRCSQMAATPIWRAGWQADWRAGRAACLPR